MFRHVYVYDEQIINGVADIIVSEKKGVRLEFTSPVRLSRYGMEGVFNRLHDEIYDAIEEEDDTGESNNLSTNRIDLAYQIFDSNNKLVYELDLKDD